MSTESTPPVVAPARLMILGAGGHGKVVADIARAGGWVVVGFVDADDRKLGQVVEPSGTLVLFDETGLFGALESAERTFDAVAVAIGDNAARLALLERLAPRVLIPVLVHSRAVVSPSATLGTGCVVMPNAVINAAARLGTGVIVNTAAVVEHDCVVGDGAHLSPNCTLGGGVEVGASTWVGVGATVIPRVRIGRGSTVGAGAVVICDVPEGVTVVGCPARIVRGQ